MKKSIISFGLVIIALAFAAIACEIEEQAEPTATPTVAVTPTATLKASPTPTLAPTATPTPTPIPPTATPTPSPPPPPPCKTQAPDNPWGYDFCPENGSLIVSPPSDFCAYFPCIGNFWNGRGYVIQCEDGTFSKSGGIRGSCSHHGGNLRPLYAH